LNCGCYELAVIGVHTRDVVFECRSERAGLEAEVPESLRGPCEAAGRNVPFPAAQQ